MAHTSFEHDAAQRPFLNFAFTRRFGGFLPQLQPHLPVELDDAANFIGERLITTLRPHGIILTPPLCDMPAILACIALRGSAGQHRGWSQ